MMSRRRLFARAYGVSASGVTASRSSSVPVRAACALQRRKSEANSAHNFGLLDARLDRFPSPAAHRMSTEAYTFDFFAVLGACY